MANRYPKFTISCFSYGFINSEAFNEICKGSTIKVFIYIKSCLQYTDVGKKRKRNWIPTNNGDIEISMDIMRKKLGICKGTCTKAVKKLITVGAIRLTRIGANKTCHKYKVLVDVVPTAEERWRHYPEKNWEHEAPKNPRNFIGKDTRFKSHPKKVDRKTSESVYKTRPNNFIGEQK